MGKIVTFFFFCKTLNVINGQGNDHNSFINSAGVNLLCLRIKNCWESALRPFSSDIKMLWGFLPDLLLSVWRWRVKKKFYFFPNIIRDVFSLLFFREWIFGFNIFYTCKFLHFKSCPLVFIFIFFEFVCFFFF